MNHSLTFFFCVLLVTMLSACSASDETAQQADGARTPAGANAFTTKQDTVVASVVTQLKPTARVLSSKATVSNVAFTIQVGAFNKPQHALKAQHTAKSRFNTFPVFNQFEPSMKVYRVSIGKFDSREEALRILKHVMLSYPEEYQECWLNIIAK
ncbi:MAG: SPOR domain-containing protein [Ignavibacteriae bacterium]|nr:SPOR domain-containing protein [Ignavibacteriota bacterium]